VGSTPVPSLPVNGIALDDNLFPQVSHAGILGDEDDERDKNMSDDSNDNDSTVNNKTLSNKTNGDSVLSDSASQRRPMEVENRNTRDMLDIQKSAGECVCVCV
jgi:hypothetical protein